LQGISLLFGATRFHWLLEFNRDSVIPCSGQSIPHSSPGWSRDSLSTSSSHGRSKATQALPLSGRPQDLGDTPLQRFTRDDPPVQPERVAIPGFGHAQAKPHQSGVLFSGIQSSHGEMYDVLYSTPPSYMGLLPGTASESLSVGAHLYILLKTA
jgi:hypothetical protein